MSELNLLCECISTEGEAEGGGVKFIYMDEGTIYRFENNRMKKISKQLINKAKREISKRQKIPQTQLNEGHPSRQDVDNGDNGDIDNYDIDNERKPMSKAKRTKKPIKPIVTDEDNEDNEDDEEPEVLPSPKLTKSVKRAKQLKRSLGQENLLTPTIDLDEYYSNKHKMEYMTNEITRLNGKIGKLKQYKSIVNKLTGGEIDDLPNNGSTQQLTQQDVGRTQQSKNNERQGVNDSLFIYGF